MTTPSELAEKLGLENPRLFAQEVAWKLADRHAEHGDPPLREVTCRQQGRSTFNLLAALCHLVNTDDDVVLVAHNRYMANVLMKRAGDWAFRLGLDPRRIKAVTSPDQALHGRDARQVFPDHAVCESLGRP